MSYWHGTSSAFTRLSVVFAKLMSPLSDAVAEPDAAPAAGCLLIGRSSSRGFLADGVGISYNASILSMALHMAVARALCLVSRD